MQYVSPGKVPSVSLPSIREISAAAVPPRNGVISVAAVDFAQMIEAARAQPVVDAMIEHFGLTEAGMRDIVTHSGPHFLQAHQRWMDRRGGLHELNDLARSGGPQQFADRPELVEASISEQEGRVYLQHLFLDDAVVESVSRQIAARLDINAAKLGKLMPHLATLFVGVLCKSLA